MSQFTTNVSSLSACHPTFENEDQMPTGTIWACRCGRHYKRPVVTVDWLADARRERDEMADLIRTVSDEVVLVPVATLNAIAERAERAESQLRGVA